MEMNEITRLLDSIQEGIEPPDGELIAQVYAELRRVARSKMAGEKPGQTLQATALVHEAWLRLGRQSFDSRAHFFSAAAEAMRRILIEQSRRRAAVKRGGNAERLSLEEVEILSPSGRDEEILALHEALEALAEQDERKAELVKLRYFVGLTIEEAAGVLGVSVPTAKRDWTFARTWLYRWISDQA